MIQAHRLTELQLDCGFHKPGYKMFFNLSCYEVFRKQGFREILEVYGHL